MAKAYDLILRGGQLVDGTGAPAVAADLAVSGDRIAAVGRIDAAPETPEIDVSGQVVAPGFIDIHAHGELMLLAQPLGESKLTSGVTSEFLGGCGTSVFPLGVSTGEHLTPDAQRLGIDLDWTDAAQYLQRVGTRKLGLNRGFMVGHSTVRASLIGFENRAATPAERDEMRALFDEALDSGAFGISMGLHRLPGAAADRTELREVAERCAARGVPLLVHLRSEGDGLEAAIEEVIGVVRQTECALHLHHLKVSGARNWRKIDWLERRLAQAVKLGLDITADRYPYVADDAPLASFLPAWALEGGRDQQLERLEDPIAREAMAAEVAGVLSGPEDFHRVMISWTSSPELAPLQGRRLDDIAAERAAEPMDTLFDILREDRGRTACVRFLLSEENLDRVLNWPFVMLASGAPARPAQGPAAEGRPHPRAFGTPTRFLRRFVREKQRQTLEQAVYKLTGLPARRLGLNQRGVLREGAFADVVVFDPKAVTDRATFAQPLRPSEGVAHVLVNGQAAVADGALTGTAAGRVLRRE